MKKVKKVLKGRMNIVFLDFEGSQRTSEMIAIGAVSCSLYRDGTIRRMRPPFRMYVRSIDQVGRFVTDLTGITDEMLRKQGHSFYDTMQAFRKYVGLQWKKSIFVTFGTNDMRILNQTIAHNINFPADLCRQIQKNYWDFSAFIGNYVRDDTGQNLSLIHLCQTYELDLVEPAHDPQADAINLANLYNAFLTKSDITLKEYRKVLLNYPKLPEPIKSVMNCIKKDKLVSSEDFDQMIMEEIR